MKLRKRRRKNRIIHIALVILTTDKLTEVWETVNRDLLESVCYKWMSRLALAIEHEGDYIPIRSDKAGIASIVPGRCRAVMTFVIPDLISLKSLRRPTVRILRETISADMTPSIVTK
jgi:hypothetical protein